jgi:hypothetical protein
MDFHVKFLKKKRDKQQFTNTKFYKPEIIVAVIPNIIPPKTAIIIAAILLYFIGVVKMKF